MGGTVDFGWVLRWFDWLVQAFASIAAKPVLSSFLKNIIVKMVKVSLVLFDCKQSHVFKPFRMLYQLCSANWAIARSSIRSLRPTFVIHFFCVLYCDCRGRKRLRARLYWWMYWLAQYHPWTQQHLHTHTALCCLYLMYALTGRNIVCLDSVINVRSDINLKHS